jgi:hypothetical protein
VVVTGQLILHRLHVEPSGVTTPQGQLVGTGGQVAVRLNTNRSALHAATTSNIVITITSLLIILSLLDSYYLIPATTYTIFVFIFLFTNAHKNSLLSRQLFYSNLGTRFV